MKLRKTGILIAVLVIKVGPEQCQLISSHCLMEVGVYVFGY